MKTSERFAEVKNKANLTSTLTAMKDVSGWKLLYSDTNELVKAAKNSDLKPQTKQ